ncbi:hypothetical protein BBJ28_00001401 [Nothophytophthora sp. Chile5]|nr:hypothetical protein BBJ28_00001401 [Nothophytophthora sp. Chile5]
MSRARQVIVEDQVSAYWASSASAFGLGVLVGQLSPSNVGDFVLSAVPVPSEIESGEAASSLADVSVEWVQEVAQQVDRLLPGGISVLGLYVIAAQDVANQAEPYLRAAAEAIQLPSSVRAADDVHYLALVKPGGVTFKSYFDVVNVTKTLMLPAESKAQTTEFQFKQYRTLVDLDEPIPFVTVAPTATLASVEMAERRTNELQTELQPFIRRVEGAMAVLKKTGDPEVQHMNMLTLTPPASQKSIYGPVGGVKGAISCVAFVAQDEPEANEVAVNYLKRDFVKSLLLRVALAREKWAEDDEGKTRGTVPWQSSVSSSSYFLATIHVFPEDDAVEVVKNALEILGGAEEDDDEAWTAMENNSFLVTSEDAQVGFIKPDYKLVFFLFPIGIALLMLLIQQGMIVQDALYNY